MNLDAILAERLAILGGTGSGKSYTARGLAERVLAKGDRLGVIDPTGVWWGLRSGFPVVLFGGDHADLPINEHAGRIVAQAVATSQQSWILDTSALKTKAAERRFMLDFLDGLYEANRNRITLIVDEADRFSPQRMSPEVARLHERMEEIVRRGRVRGFTPWLITQRPASLNKDVLSQATAYICMKMTGAHDRGAIADVIEGQADKATAKAIVDAMPKHKIGSGLVWAPMQEILLPVQFPKIKTFDSMRAESVLERGDKKLPPIDLGALKEKLATVEEEARENSPQAVRALKAEIAKLKAELAKKSAGGDTKRLNLAESQANYDKGFTAGVTKTAKAYAKVLTDGKYLLERIAAMASEGAPKLSATPANVPVPPAIIQRQEIPARAPSPHRPVGNGHAPSDAALPRGEKACLICAAQQPGGATREQLTVVTGYKRSSRDTYVQRLREKGYVDAQGDRIVATDAGIAALGSDYEPMPTGDALREFHLRRLPEGERRVLEVLIEQYPEGVPRETIDEITQYKRSSRDTYLQRLSARQLVTIHGRGEVRASDELFA